MGAMGWIRGHLRRLLARWFRVGGRENLTRENVGELDAYQRRNPASAPILHALDAERFPGPQASRQGGRTAEFLYYQVIRVECHVVIKHHV